jgi:tetratricopeptide (TPR) repeat protein
MEPLLFKGIQDIRDALGLLRQRGVPITVVRMSSTRREIFADFPCEFHIAPDDSLKTQLYGTADVLLYASHYDSCPRPPQEAMAAGCAVVCTATSGALEYCRDGINALMVPVKSPERIADAVERLARDPDLRRRLIEGGLATAAEFPCEREWNEWEALLHRWVDESRARPGNERASNPAPRAAAPIDRPAETPCLALPPCALVGQLGSARELLRQGKFREAWNATLAAIEKRPFHPEAHLLLAEISQAAGDTATARHCAQRAREMTPKWKRPAKFLKKLSGRARPVKRDWLALPAIPARPRISVCLIARNEEAFLGRCLTSVKPIADQLVVIDTGSTDRTVEIARAHGAEVHHFEWCDDFSAARNAALEHATGDWVLAIDADEELLATEHTRLFADLNSAHVLGVRLPLTNAGLEHEGRSFVPRLFRNAPGLFYVSRVHEQIFSSILARAEEWGLQTAMGTAQLLHHGYSPELVRERRKTERNLHLLEKAVREIPSDANLLMNLGLELVRTGRFGEGLARYEEAFAALSSYPDQQQVPELREALLTQFSSQLMRARRYEDIVRVLRSPVASLSELTATLLFSLGLALMKLRRFEEAAACFRQCLARREQPVLSPINPEILKAGPAHCMAQCLIELGHTDAAGDALLAALKSDPDSQTVRMDLARVHAASGRPVDALRLLHGLISEAGAHPDAWRLGGEIALANPELLDFAIDWTGEAVRHLPDEPVLARQRGAALLLAGDPAGARPYLCKARQPSDPSQRAALCLCNFLTGDLAVDWPSADEPAVSAQFLKWYQRMVQTPAAGLLAEINTRLPDLARCLPTAASRLEAAIAEAAS